MADFSPHEIADEDWEVLKPQKMESCMTAQKSNVNSFVQHSATDYAILQGPPGSGKTTAIIELIAQCAKQGKRVLLCGSTQASIDNVLTRIMANPTLLTHFSPAYRLEGRHLRRECSFLGPLEQQEQYQRMGFSEEEATDLILRQSNLTCGTMQGILNHPWISEDRSKSGRLMKDPQPQWDVLIIDEASKTTFQQFIIPAAFSSDGFWSGTCVNSHRFWKHRN